MNYLNLTIYDYIDYAILPTIINLLIFWVVSFLFMLLDDYCEKHKLLKKYKIQGNDINGIDWISYYKSLKLVISNQIFVNITLTLLMTPYSKNMDSNSLPLVYLPLQIIGIIILEDILFYSVHYLLHTKKLYKSVHKIHHEWIIPVAVSAIYAHPIEHILSNMLPIMISGYVVRLNWISYNIWVNIATLNALLVHSDHFIYKFGYSHNKHHKYRKYNYGTNGLIDIIMGTYC